MRAACGRTGLVVVITTYEVDRRHDPSPIEQARIAGDGSVLGQRRLLDGIEATRQIRLLEKQNNWTETSLFVVTGQDSPTDRASAENVGANEYLVKPVGIKTLDRFVKRYFPAFEGS